MTWKSSNFTRIEQTTHYSFCQLTVSNIDSHKLLTTLPLTDDWTFITDDYNCLSYWLNVWNNLLHSTSGPKDHLLSPLHLRPPPLFAVCRGSKDTGSPPTGARVQQCMLGQVRRQNPSRLPCDYQSPLPTLLPNLSSFLDCCLFQMVAINLVSDLFLYEDSRLSPPKFFSLLVSMPTCTLNTGSFNKAAPPTNSRI